MQLTGHLGHLTYCANIHAGESWPDIFLQLKNNLPAVKKRVSPSQPFGIGLRLSALAAQVLVENHEIEAFRQWLDAEGLYVFTINGFAYGNFHGVPVKEQVYRPDWSHAARLDYTRQLADILSELLPVSVEGSISTVPMALMTDVIDAAYLEAARSNLVEFVAHVDKIKVASGQCIRLALEPEPGCYLSMTDDVITFFNECLFVEKSRQQLALMINKPVDICEEILRDRLGLCLDTCHAAVMFEDPLDVVSRLERARINIVKLQLTAALKVTDVNEESLQALTGFSDPVYLHQTSVRLNGEVHFFLDLPEAFAAFKANKIARDAEWRIHYHVPIFLEYLASFQTTHAELARLLASHRLNPVCQHLEVETYTFDVLPERFRELSVVENIVRELDWVCGYLAS